MFKERIRHFHLVGIGGIGMSGIALILLKMGYRVSGSDLFENKNVRILRDAGADVRIGHDKKNVPPSADVIVYSSAVDPDKNPETLEGKRRGIPVIPRGEMLAELARVKETIAVSGSHGKTTTTSMLAHVFHLAGLDPTVIIGGKLHLYDGKNAYLGSGELLITEADESDGSFLKLSPVVSVITNVDKEHLEHYSGFEEIKKAFREFADRVPYYGFSVLNADDAATREFLPELSKRFVTFGVRYPADYGARGIEKTKEGYLFALHRRGEYLGELEIKAMGRHNVYNALATAAVSLESGVDFEVLKEALARFQNAERRLERLGSLGNAIFFEDYGHHPRELAAVFDALREFFPDREIFFVFQPHRYSRTFHLWGEFVKVLKPLRGIVAEIYPAGEAPIPGVEGRKLAHETESLFASSPEEIKELLTKELKSPTKKVVVFLGAGSIGRWSKEIFRALKGEF